MDDNKKLEELLKGIYNSLTDEQKEEVINDTTGNADGRFSSVWDADSFALDHGYSLEITRDWSKITEIRDNYARSRSEDC